MEIFFLGTSSGWPLPRLGCTCEICASENPKDKRLRPSLLINENILIDANPDVYHEFTRYRLDTKKITDILITHAHDDHIAGLYDLTHIYPKRKINLITTRSIISQVRQKLGISMLSFQAKEIMPFQKLNLNANSSVWFLPVEHSIEAYGIKIKAPKPVFYAPEFRRILPSTKKEIGDVDLAIIDGSSKTSLGQAKGHETIEEGIRLSRDIKAKKVLFTNIGHKTDRQIALDVFVKEKGGEKFGIAFDGLSIKL